MWLSGARLFCRLLNPTFKSRTFEYSSTLVYSQKPKPGLLCPSLHRTDRSNFSTSRATDWKVIAEEKGEMIIRSPYRDVPEDERSFGEFMFSFLDEYSNYELMVDYPTGRRITGSEIKDHAVKVASALTRYGYRKGDVVMVFASNCLEYPILFLGCSIAGIAVSTANPIYTPGELARQLAHSETKAVFTAKDMLPTVHEALNMNQEARERVKDIMLIDGEGEGCRPFSTLIADDGSMFPENVDIDPRETIFTLPYSSGTTGLPKGVMLSHFNMVNNLKQGMSGQMQFREGEEILMGLLPFYHIYGLMVLQFSPLTQGAKLIIHPRFDPQAFLKSIEQHKITYANLVPPIVLFLAKHPAVSDFNLSSLQTLVSAAAPLGLGVTREVESRLNVNLLQAYGLTECSPLTHYDEVPHKRGTIGRLIPNTQAKVIHPVSGETLGVGESGEILIRGPQVMVGYLKNQEATNETVKHGWLYTGDIGHVDEDGYFTISDRQKELIKYKGYQVAPAELEALLCTHPHIQDAAVVGLPIGEEVGEVPKAFVVATPGAKVTEQDVHDFVNKNVAPYKKLRGGVEFIDQVPKTASGKILRRTLKQF
ncbi:probable 4-coumarate--CoA ligase 1 [Mya arenaria]|uniref:probable 4-coumarate--CoA ligase 1 n=1 Tax=Mya arenaria TaxID=6604 RepID=UPI0022E5C9CF|nr:probable 4-coumarate--CoA ligase 1 [Mya arenaria]XP_052800721.1 probable 4-coumarate--CoA ligase 1 [Mya arenaria]